MADDLIYMDHAAATPLDGQVLAAMRPYFSDQFYNPSATYGPARQVAADLQAARAKVAHWLGARPSEVIFTAGGTEANNIAIAGVMRSYPQANVVVSAIEHEAVLRPAAAYDCRLVPVGADGLVDVEAMGACIDEQTALVSVMYANNEIGTIQPIRRVAAMVQAVRRQRQAAGNTTPLYLHTDACQAAAYLDIHASRLGVDLLTLNGGKIYGPKQSGILYVHGSTGLEPLLRGGGQERGLRSGTENVPACIGLAEALDSAQRRRHEETARLQPLQKLFIDTLAEQVPAARLNGSSKQRLPNNVHITVPGYDNERLLLGMERHGVLAAAGSACSASSDEPSHVLDAIGMPVSEIQASLRFTMGRGSDETAVRRAVAALAASLDA